MTILITTFFSGFVSLLVGAYLWNNWRKQTVKNRSTELWGIAFLLYAASHFLSGITNSGFYHLDSETLDALLTLCLFLLNSFFFFIFWGVLRLITHNKWWLYFINIVFFAYFSILIIFRESLFATLEKFNNFVSYFVLFPSAIVFMGIFFILYGILIAESVKRKSGIIFIIISWFMYAILCVAKPAMMNSFNEHWYTLRAVSVLFILIGFIIMEREAKEAFFHLEEDKNQRHHLK